MRLAIYALLLASACAAAAPTEEFEVDAMGVGMGHEEEGDEEDERESDDDPEFPPVEVTVPDGVEGGQMVRVQYTTGLPARPSDGAEWTDGAGEAGAEDLEEEEVDSGEAATDAGDGSAEESQLSPEQRDLWLRLEALPGITDAPLALRHELWQAYEWDRRGDYSQAVATLQALLSSGEVNL